MHRLVVKRLQAFNHVQPVVHVAAGQSNQPSTSSERIIMVASTTNPSSYYPVAPTLTGVRVDQLQAWLDNKLSDSDDTVFIEKAGDDKYSININGEIEYVSGEELKKLKFDLKGGNDTLVIGEDVPIDIKAELGDGDDRFWGGNGNDNVNGGKGNDKIYGRGGNDTMNGGAGNDEIWGMVGQNTMIGGAGKDIFMTGTGPQNLVDFTGGEDQHPTATGAPSTASTATPRGSAPAAGTTATPTAGGTGNIVINGNNNTVYTGSAPAGSTAAGTTTSAGRSYGRDFTLDRVMGSSLAITAGYTKNADGTYTKVEAGQTVTWSQPGGAGSPISIRYEDTAGPDKGTVKVVQMTADGKGDVPYYNNPMLSAEQNETIRKSLTDGDYMAKMLDLVMGGDSKMKKKGAHGNTSASGASGSATGSAEADGAVEGSSDGYSGLNVDGAGEATSWFLVLAEGMGKIMNKFAEKMIDLLNQIEAAGDDPPYELTAKFQATSQQLAFMQQAFMTALNSLGESIKTGVTAGGAAR
jgi:RTX calcium-binding nonapeptide repeat (4 copies)